MHPTPILSELVAGLPNAVSVSGDVVVTIGGWVTHERIHPTTSVDVLRRIGEYGPSEPWFTR